MVSIILLTTLSITQENPCAGGYCFLLLALFSLFKEDILLGVHLTVEVVIVTEKEIFFIDKEVLFLFHVKCCYLGYVAVWVCVCIYICTQVEVHVDHHQGLNPEVSGAKNISCVLGILAQTAV